MAARRDSKGRFVKSSASKVKGVQDIDLGYNELVLRVAELGDLELHVGVFNEEDALHVLVNEFGTRDGVIPERPAVRAAIDNNTSNIDRRMLEIYERVQKGRGTSQGLLEDLGDEVLAMIKASLNAWTDPENAPSTRRNKRKNDPLVDTGFTRDKLFERRVVRL